MIPRFCSRSFYWPLPVGSFGPARLSKPAGRTAPLWPWRVGKRPTSTSAAFVASLKEEIASLLRDILLVCAEQDLLGGTHFAVDGVKLTSNAAKEWRGTFAAVQHKKAKLEEKVKRVLAQHERADKEEAAPAPAQQAEPQRRQDQLKRLEQWKFRGWTAVELELHTEFTGPGKEWDDSPRTPGSRR